LKWRSKKEKLREEEKALIHLIAPKENRATMEEEEILGATYY